MAGPRVHRQVRVKDDTLIEVPDKARRRLQEGRGQPAAPEAVMIVVLVVEQDGSVAANNAETDAEAQ